MARLTPVHQFVFGSTSAAQEVAQFGSLANSTPNFTLDPVVVQALAQFTDGWFAASIGGNSPAQEDMNALFYLAFYQLAYLKQAGITEWDAITPYYEGSIVNNGTGALYISTLDNNVGNDPTAGGDGWFPYGTEGLVAGSLVGNVTFIAGNRSYSPSAITLDAGVTVTCPTATEVKVKDSITVPPGASLVVAPGGSVGVV